MNDSSNPYAAPTADIHPVAVQWLGSGSVSLGKVATGLGLIYTAIVLILIVAIISFGLPMFQIDRDLAALITRGCGLLILGGGLLNLIGTMLCLATPAETGARGFIYTSVGAMLLGTLLLVAEALQAQGFIGKLPRAIVYVQLVLGIISTLSFVLYLRRLAQFIGRSDLAGRAIGVFTYFCVLIAVQLGFVFYVKARGDVPNDPWVGVASVLAIIVAYGLALILYANLVVYIRRAILGGRRS